jgi:short-subunit dehydrogenase
VQINQQRIILTGAASGIGSALLSRFATYPCRVIAADADDTRLRAAIAAISSSRATITPFVGDLASPLDNERLFSVAVQAMGGIDLFVANAGFAYYETLQQADWARMERIYAVNTLAPLYAAAMMRELGASRPYKVVITCSAMGLLALPGYAVYGATKAALHHFAEGYRYELDDPRKLLLVYPIGTRTNFFRASGAPVSWPTQTPDYVAGLILRGIERDQQRVYTSPQFRLLMLVGRIAPPALRLWQWIELQRFRRWSRAR